ncbi:hypothetical protein BCR44DRAFT_97253 [Catenaria anguillulae PL171]|uniref:DM10 domain-containing protein n=1 Tax=Catenaria anguillulae PL171 TaxID=765915 RepID=A0A1Y2HKI9_9FUNG|nr:hypothetical protein BCR44DRAFT_97253 [Catenaria anguillulae PL171]
MPEDAVLPYRRPTGPLPPDSPVEPERIPFLPGNSFSDVFKSDYRKSHLLDYKNGYKVPREVLGKHGGFPETMEELESLIAAATARNADLTYGGKLSLTRPTVAPAFVPSFVMYDKVVLRFRAYFKQTMHDSTEQYLLRIVMILYYLEDDSIAVVEPPQANSGILQGVLIKRQRLPKSSTDFYTIQDFNNGVNVTFYGKTFHIVDCDDFTKDYMESKLKIQLQPAEPVPTDKYLQSRIRPTPQRSAQTRHDKLWKFLQHDRHVLRFYCVWQPEDTGVDGAPTGEVRDFVMHYYLVDDCVDVKEVHRPNDGRDPSPLLLKRQPLPKAFHELDDLQFGEYYNWREFRTGGVVNVLNRKFIIRDCDEFTRKWYKTNLNLDMPALQLSRPTPTRPQRTYPPYNGFGSEEDSLQSCLHLVLQPPKKEFQHDDTRVLRFVAVMDSRHREDATRRFIISVYLPEVQVSIYEPPQRNTGTIGGKFLEKCKVLVPGADMQHPRYYAAGDFYVGARIGINAHTFRLVDADEYVYKYMEGMSSVYKMASAEEVVRKVKQLGRAAVVRAVLAKRPVSATGSGNAAAAERKVSLDEIKQALEGSGLVLHEMVTIYRQQDKVRELISE